jgi:hypothetical protein
MSKYLGSAVAAAFVLALASFGYAQPAPGTDRPGGTAAQESARPDMDKGNPNTSVRKAKKSKKKVGKKTKNKSRNR